MEPRFLFPSKFRYLGYLLAIPGFVLGYIDGHYGNELSVFLKQLSAADEVANFANETALTLVIAGLLLTAFSKVKHEDELTGKIRIYALYWAILVNYVIYALMIGFITICTLLNVNAGGGFFGPISYLLAFSELNLFTPLIIFIVIFNYLLFRNKNEFVIKPMRYLPYKPYRILAKWISLTIIVGMVANYIFKLEWEILQLPAGLLPLTLLAWAFSKERNEDEFISSLRLEAMQIAIYVNYSILLVSNWLLYGSDFWRVETLYITTIPVIFIAWFQYKLYRINKQNEAKPLAL